MAVRPILQFPDKRLAQVAKPIAKMDKALLKLLSDMAETMYAAPGIGLAATQVGELVRAIVIDLGPDEERGIPGKLFKIINPEIVEHEGKMESEEGCLSIPGIRETIERSSFVIVNGYDQNEKPLRIEAEGLFAACLQHEIDHLNGVLFIDHLSRLKRSALVSRFKKSSIDSKK